MTLLPVTDAGGLTYLHRHTAALGKGRHHRELQSVFVFAFFSLAAPSTLMNPPGWRVRLLGYPGRDLVIFSCELGHGLLGSLNLAVRAPR